MFVKNLQVGLSTQMAIQSSIPCGRCGQTAGMLVQVRYYASEQAASDGEWTYTEVCNGCIDVLKRDATTTATSH